MQFLSHMVYTCLAFKKQSKFLQSGCAILLSFRMSNGRVIQFLSPAFGGVTVCDVSHPDQCVCVTSHVVLTCLAFMANDAEYLFILCHLSFLSSEMFKSLACVLSGLSRELC